VSKKRVTLLYVLAGVTGLALFLGVRYMATGRIARIDIIAILIAAIVAALVSWLALRHVRRQQTAGETSGGKKGKVWTVALMVAMLYSALSIYGMYDHDREARRNQQVKGDLRKNTRIVRLRAGERDATGWVPAQSTDGRFAVSMPNVFHETVTKTAYHDREEEFSSLGTRFQDAKFVATVIPYEDLNKEPAERQRNFLAKMERTRGGRSRF